MRLGIFSDIHGNRYAFEVIWKALKKEKCDYYIFAGDICGYYYYQDEAADILKNIKNLIAVRGNHDDLFLKIVKGAASMDEYTKKYGRSFEFLEKGVKKETLKFLESLPLRQCIENGRIAIFHGSPRDLLNEYIYPDSSIRQFAALPYRVVILGHTHYPMDRTIGAVRIVNPGSCGQPRDGNPPSYAVFDLARGEYRIARVPYKVDLMIRDVMKKEKTNTYLIDVLKRSIPRAQ